MSRKVGSSERTYQDLVIKGLSRFPEREVLVDGHLRLTGRELYDRVARTVNAYISLGLGPESRIALLGANSSDFVVAQLAAASLGASFTGLHPLSSPSAISEVLQTLNPDALVFDQRSSFEAAAHAKLTLTSSKLRFLSFGVTSISTDLSACVDVVAKISLSELPRVQSDHVASISFTSGTTGRPKGVVRSQLSSACALSTMLAEWDWPPQLRFLAIAPLTHATGSMIPAVLLRGGTVHVRSGFEVGEIYAQICAEQITATFLVPTMIYRLLDHPDRFDTEISSLRLLIYGAAPISTDRLGEGLRRWGQIFMQLYGQVEAPNTICTLRIADHMLESNGRLSSCGKPSVAIDVALLDDQGLPVPHGTPGEVCVRGPLVMDGYLDDPAATRTAFREGWLRTGDMAIQDEDGFLRIVDRRKDMIISGGFNIFASDVERALNSHPFVSECAVIGTPDGTWGEAVTAYVVPVGVHRDEVSLVAHVRKNKGSAWSPKHVHFVDSLPLTALGKTDKKALRNAHWASDERAVH